MRGRFAWLGASAVLFAIGALATAATQDTWLDGYAIVAYGLAPLGFIPLTAGAIASVRANRFVESLFTAPVERRAWLLAKILALLTFAVAYYVALTPMFLVYAHYIGLPFLLGRFLLWTPGILLSCIAIGTLIGVLFIGRSVAAPAGTSMAVLLAYAGLVPLQELMVARGVGAGITGRITLASPAVLLKNALGFTLGAGSIPAHTRLTWISLLAVLLSSFGLALWVFLRAQGVETWEATGRQRSLIALAIPAIVLLPVLMADTGYDDPARPANRAPALRVFGRGSGSLALVPPGGPMPAHCCSPLLNRDAASFGTDERTRRDLLVILPVESTQKMTDLRVGIAGESGLEVTADSPLTLETHAFPANSGPDGADGRRIRSAWIARVPATFRPTQPWDIGGNRYPMSVTATYRVPPDPQPHTLSARGAVEAQISNAIYAMGAASSVLPVLCLGAAWIRWRRTR